MVYSPLADELSESRISLQEEYTFPPVLQSAVQQPYPVTTNQRNPMNRLYSFHDWPSDWQHHGLRGSTTQPRVNGRWQWQMEIAIFDSLQYRHPSTDHAYSCAKFGAHPTTGRGFSANGWNISNCFYIYTLFYENSPTMSRSTDHICPYSVPILCNFWHISR